MLESLLIVISSLILLTLCVVTLSGKMTNMMKIKGTPRTRAVFGCAAHGHAVKGDSAHVCYADSVLGCRRQMSRISSVLVLNMRIVSVRERERE